jgi:hypothetical protein
MSGARRAVVIGINKYHDERIGDLRGAVNDATDIHHILTNSGQFVIDPEKHFLTDERATGERIRSAISDLFWRTDEKCDVALFYFAGHGRRDHFDHGYLLPHDVNTDAPFVKGIRIQELRELFRYSEPKRTAILILDCCYSGLVLDRAGNGDEWVKKFHEDLVLDDRATGRFILAAADADKTAREIERVHRLDKDVAAHPHGLYTFHLIEGLRGGKTNEYGQVSLGDLSNYVANALGKKDQPRHSFIGSGEHYIVLATVEEEQKRRLQERVGKLRDLVERMTNEQDSMAMMSAIQIFNELDMFGITSEEIAPLKTTIRDLINASAGIIGDWWLDNGQKVHDATMSTQWYKLIEDVLTNFRMTKIKQLKNREMTFVSLVMKRITTPTAGVNEVIELIKRFDRGNPQMLAISQNVMPVKATNDIEPRPYESVSHADA